MAILHFNKAIELKPAGTLPLRVMGSNIVAGKGLKGEVVSSEADGKK